MTGTAPNPNAPKGFRDPAARKEERKRQARPSPFLASPFGGAPVPVASADDKDPEGEGAEAGPTDAAEGGEDHKPPSIPPSPLRASMPAYSQPVLPGMPPLNAPRDFADDEAAERDPEGEEPKSPEAEDGEVKEEDGEVPQIIEPHQEAMAAPALRTRASPFGGFPPQATEEPEVGEVPEDTVAEPEVAEPEAAEGAPFGEAVEETMQDVAEEVKPAETPEEAEEGEIAEETEEPEETPAEKAEAEEAEAESADAEPEQRSPAEDEVDDASKVAAASQSGEGGWGDDFSDFEDEAQATPAPAAAEPAPQEVAEEEVETEQTEEKKEEEVNEAPAAAASGGGWEDADFSDFEDEAPKPSPEVVEEPKEEKVEETTEPQEDEAPKEPAMNANGGESNSSWVMLSQDQQPATPVATQETVQEEGEVKEEAQEAQEEEAPAKEQDAFAMNELDELLGSPNASAPVEEKPFEEQPQPTTAFEEEKPEEIKLADDLQEEVQPSSSVAMSATDVEELSRLREETQALKQQLEASKMQVSSQEIELSSLRDQNAELDSQLQELKRESSAREEELNAKFEAEAANRQRVEAELSDLRFQGSASQDELGAKLMEVEAKCREGETDRESLRQQLQVAESMCKEGESERDQLMSQLQASEQKCTEAALQASELQDKASQLQDKVATLEEAAKNQPVAQTQIEYVQKEGSDEFELPDFVYNCGNSEVMAYVQKLMSENVELRKKPQAVESANPTQQIQLSSSFDLSEATEDAAMAFAGSVGEADSHQIPSLLALLKQHSESLAVASQVCAALENLTFTDVDNRSTIVQRGGVEAILSVLRRHEDGDGNLLRPAVDALWNLTFDDEAITRASDSGVIEQITSVMAKHSDAAELQGGACAVLLNLAVRDQNRWKIVQSGGVSLVAQAMQTHSKCDEVLEQGCQALYMLAYHTELRPHVLAGNHAANAAAVAMATPQGCGGRAQKWGKWLQEVLAC
eukprot:TRINITY_DN25138_c0_g1_i1.p1 TRINITY_DN25138_c0_g1~~TRINITY_DN25138_c0_g1_i1.p1  ORF type:complete len:1074 (+),score=401.59 TRINITY_DN25138_c0_g1_i1:283-3222(+)